MSTRNAPDNRSIPEGLSQAYQQYRRELRTFFELNAWDADTVDDLMQTLFLQALKGRPSEEVRDPRQYLFRAAWNVLHNANQRSRRERPRMVSIDTEGFAAHAERSSRLWVEDDASTAVAQAEMDRILSLLPRTCRVAVLLTVLAGGGYWWSKEAGAFATSVGEQSTAKLSDGSFIYLNTDTRVEVDFSERARDVRLVRGEALFVVERDSARPFTVIAGDIRVRAIGTRFNVRRRAEGAEVAVVEGVVQVASFDAPKKLAAGEQAKIVAGRITPRPRQQPVADAIAWRERRLVFHDARLVDVAEEFNRYNRTKIRIEGEAAQEMLLSGIFDADRPQALMLYAAKNAEFSVSPEGNDWVIRRR